MKNRRLIINALFLITISFAMTVFAQNNGEILVAGDPPFTQSDFVHIVKYYERGLDIKFSDGERDELQSKISAMWRKNQESNPKNLTGFMELVRKMNTRVADEKIKANQQEFAEVLLADLKTMSRNGWSDIVIGVYENSHRNNSATTAKSNDDSSRQTETTVNRNELDFQPLAGAIKMSDLTGKWVKGTVASYGYRNTVTSDYRSGYGSANQHDIYAGGNFDYSNYAQISGYGCTTELFTSMKGRVSVSGSEVTFTYVSGTVKGKDSCKSQGFTRPAQINKTTYRLERGKDGLRMCEVGKENPYCLYKAKE
ncbi:MAG: hypothetical protein M3209_06355 [Acidobacteriota bacterium]|nr:hypothetical protein [Acidobacteriota bacterium]